jgi:CheY-like chemotaxis protein
VKIVFKSLPSRFYAAAISYEIAQKYLPTASGTDSALKTFVASNSPKRVFVVLLVDDDRECRDLLAEFLSLKGHSVQCAANGSDALQWPAQSQTRPGLILLDLMMPVLDGWGFLARRAGEPALAGVPVVILSGIDVRRKAKEAGAVAVLRKPVEPQNLPRIIEHFAEGICTPEG